MRDGEPGTRRESTGTLGAGAPLRLEEWAAPGPGQLGLRVLACGICRTDLHVVDGDLTDAALPVVPGHQVVARVETVGEGIHAAIVGSRVGVP